MDDAWGQIVGIVPFLIFILYLPLVCVYLFRSRKYLHILRHGTVQQATLACVEFDYQTRGRGYDVPYFIVEGAEGKWKAESCIRYDYESFGHAPGDILPVYYLDGTYKYAQLCVPLPLPGEKKGWDKLYIGAHPFGKGLLFALLRLSLWFWGIWGVLALFVLMAGRR